MSRRRILFTAISLIARWLLFAPLPAIAQHHGGGGHGMGGSIPGGSNRPTGLDEKDTLKDFHRALAVQATSQQIAEFQALLKSTEAAKTELTLLQQALNKATDVPSRGAAFDQALAAARTGNKHFVDGFSDKQKSGLKENTKKLFKTDSDLDQEGKRLDQSLAIAAEAGVRAESLGKVLTEFSDQELALGREMSIVLASGQDLTFALPQVHVPVKIEGQSVGVVVSGGLSQTAADKDLRTFRLELTADLSDLQQNITQLLRARLDQANSCGERVNVRQASLAPATPASLLVIVLHYERWTCTRMNGQPSSSELAEEDGTAEVKLTAAVGDSNALKVTAAFGRIDAGGMLAQSLRTGALGDNLREQCSQLLLAAIQGGTDLKTALPLAVQNAATIQSAKFQDASAGDLSLTLDGQVQISDEQANQLAAQLNQAMSARAAAAK